MALYLGRDFWCAFRGAWVAESEFNGPAHNVYYHEPENRAAYMAGSLGKCECLKCQKTDKTECKKCENPNWLRFEQLNKRSRCVDGENNVIGSIFDMTTRCEQCLAQYKIKGKLR